MKKVPLVVYVDGERKVVGDAFVEVEGRSFDIIATVNDPEMAEKIQSKILTSVSMGSIKTKEQ